MKDKALRFVARCVHCGRAKNMHRAFTLDCPNGKRTRIGYSTFGPETYAPADSEPSAQQGTPRRGGSGSGGSE